MYVIEIGHQEFLVESVEEALDVLKCLSSLKPLKNEFLSDGDGLDHFHVLKDVVADLSFSVARRPVVSIEEFAKIKEAKEEGAA